MLVMPTGIEFTAGVTSGPVKLASCRAEATDGQMAATASRRVVVFTGGDMRVSLRGAVGCGKAERVVRPGTILGKRCPRPTSDWS